MIYRLITGGIFAIALAGTASAATCTVNGYPFGWGTDTPVHVVSPGIVCVVTLRSGGTIEEMGVVVPPSTVLRERLVSHAGSMRRGRGMWAPTIS